MPVASGGGSGAHPFFPFRLRPFFSLGWADVTCDDGDGRVVVRQRISFTDFPLPEVTLYLEYGTLMLPRER
jgi:hypothetical protein